MPKDPTDPIHSAPVVADLEKGSHHHLEQHDYSDNGDHTHKLNDNEHDVDADVDEGFDHGQLNKIIRRIDVRLIPILSAMYCVSLMDRSNLSLARAANKGQMNTDLGFTEGNRYSIVTVVFFVPYILFEIPSQIGLRKFGARWWLGGATIAWGLVMLGMGYVPDWKSLAGLRVLLGAFEAVLFPGAAYLIACWYPRKQMALRMTLFYQIPYAIAGLSSILAYGVSQLHGRQGHSGWRWIFILYGAITIGIGAISLFLIADFPDKATFLSESERSMILARIERDRGDSQYDPMTARKFFAYLLDFKLWLFGIFFGAAAMGTYSLAYFLPGMLANMGFNSVQSQLLVAPPSVWSVVPAFICAKIADKWKLRAHMVAFNACCVIIGTAMYSQLPTSKLAARYVGVFFAAGGANAAVPLVVSWAQTTIRSQSKRGFTSALIVAWGGVGGILASVAFIEKERARGYPTGIYLTFGLNSFVVLGCIFLEFWFRYQNRRADQGLIVIEGSPEFRYGH